MASPSWGSLLLTLVSSGAAGEGRALSEVHCSHPGGAAEDRLQEPGAGA
ncbi:rCG51510, isoform CRA_b [Rattus norvegicus]|uniref:RCG51510, isoform CRA_b n=1 Tax=Rattus norvegicus TaxID=10116 RepID=A6IZZ0_RAT|nr:rCG51510, isoform CRA_b [Rattus norvegicus]